MVSALPSKKIFFLIIACLIGVGAISFAVFASKNGLNSGKPAGSSNGESLSAVSNGNGGDTNGSADANGLDLVTKALKENATRDDDNDGLMNWEETLWGTNPNNPDTDGDGTKDGDEVKQNRNPLKAGPNDKLAATSANGMSATRTGTDSAPATNGSQTGSQNVTLENTETAKISRELFSNYLKAKQSGTTIDSNTQQEILNQTLSNKSLMATSKMYSRSDIQISTDSDLKKYGNALGLDFYTGKTDTSMTEIQILQNALEKNSPEKLAPLDPIVTGYTSILHKLLSTPVPPSFADSHIELINSLNKVLTDIRGFQVIFTDPLVGLIGVGNYYKDIDALQLSMKNVGSLFTQNNIGFTETEYGYIFMRMTQ